MIWLVSHSYTAAWASLAMALVGNQFSWIQSFVIPILFTFFGAALGFVASQIRDDRNAKRAKQSFMHAVGMELDALGNQLDATFLEVTDSTARVTRSSGAGPHFAFKLRTSVFTSQLGKLRDVADPLMIEVIHFYSDLGTLERIFESVNDFGGEYNSASVSSGEKDSARARLASGLIVLKEQLSGFGKRLRGLRAKLPPAEQSK